MQTKYQEIAQVEVPSNNVKLSFIKGRTTIIVGANGSGKTRLAIHIEKQLNDKAYRISAHRALNLNPQIEKIPEKVAREALFNSGVYSVSNMSSYSRRDDYKAAKNAQSIGLLNDFNRILQILFAQQNNQTLSTHQAAKIAQQNQKVLTDITPTLFEKLQEAWEYVLPHKKLHISGDDILVSSSRNEQEEKYSASLMSDGERAVFYILGQVLVAEKETVLIFDEPELHIHKSIMAILWDTIENLRPDCALLLITHDIEFASTRLAEKFVIQDYTFPESWNINQLPANEYFDEQTISLILGSRNPILFVEGTKNSLDLPVYRACYPDFTVIPKSSCLDVIHAVQSFNNMPCEMGLVKPQCFGIVDADGRDEESKSYLKDLNIYVLDVAEIENIFSLPNIILALLTEWHYSGAELNNQQEKIIDNLIEFVKNHQEGILKRFLERKIDEYLKNISFDKNISVTDLPSKLNEKIQELTSNNIVQWQEDWQKDFDQAILDKDLEKLLKLFDNKGLFSCLSQFFGMRHKDFEAQLIRILSNKNSPLALAIKGVVPKIEPR